MNWMNIGAQGLLMGKIAEEALCFLISYPLLGKIKKGRIGLFVVTYILWTIWSFARGLRIITNHGAEVTGREVFFQAVALMIYFSLYGLAMEGGIIRAVCNSLLQEVGVNVTTICVVAVMAQKSNASLAQTYSSIDKAYTPEVIAVCFISFVLMLFVLRKQLKRYRETPVEKYPLVKILTIVFLVNAMSPFGYLVATPGTAVRRAEDLTLYLLLGVIFFAFVFFHIRSQQIQQQNLLLRQQNQMVKDHMAIFREQIAFTRKLRHDIKRHIQVLEWGQEKTCDPDIRKKLERYRKELQNMYEHLITGVYCGEADLDAILFSLDQYCQNRQYPCRIRLAGIEWSGLSQGTGLSLIFYLYYWVKQGTQTMPEGASVSVEITGGTVSGISRLKTAISSEAFSGSEFGYLGYDIVREVKSCLKGQGEAEVRREEKQVELSIYWKK